MKKVTYREIKIIPPEGKSISEEEARQDAEQATRLQEVFSTALDPKEQERRIERAFDILFTHAEKRFRAQWRAKKKAEHGTN